MKNRKKRSSYSLLGFLVLSLILLYPAWVNSDKLEIQYQKGVVDGERTGYPKGKEDGIKEGRAITCDHAYQKGLDDGAERGYRDGKEKGRIDGYNEGVMDGERKGYENGYDDGYLHGERIGIEKGIEIGFEQGLSKRKYYELLVKLFFLGVLAVGITAGTVVWLVNRKSCKFV